MRIFVGVLGAVLVAAMAIEIFVTFLLPRRVKRDPRIVRTISGLGWAPWRRIARRLSPRAADTMLGMYGPIDLVTNLVLWISLMILGYACLLWASGSHLGVAAHTNGIVDFGSDVYFAAATMTTNGASGLAAQTPFAHAVQVLCAGTGLAVLAIVIGYLPSLYQAFSSREATVSQLDARAGSPPSAGRLIIRTTEHGGWPGLVEYLGGWEPWVAELMETHLAYPVLSYFRSQHVNQNWLAAMTTVLDACAFTIVAAPHGTVDPARFTYAIARHAVVDLTYTLRLQAREPGADRLPASELAQILAQLRQHDIEPAVDEQLLGERLAAIRSRYEPYVCALGARLELPVPQWHLPESPMDNWRTTEWH